MTRDVIEKILSDNCPSWRTECKNCVTDNCIFVKENTDRILAALEKEREGEVVLENQPADRGCFCCGAITDSREKYDSRLKRWEGLRGKQGQLIFRPTKAEKGGE